MAESYVARPDVADRQTQAVNAKIYGNALGISPNFGIDATGIFFYNITQRAISCPRPPNHPRMFFAACPPGQPYHLVGQIEHPFQQLTEDQNGVKITMLTDGYIEASRMLNPLNPSLDQDWNDGQSLQEGGNLNYLGIFWSKHNPPTQDELKAARARLEKTYRKEIERMNACKTADEARLAANDISHAAADFFGRSYSWHESNLNATDPADYMECWYCFEKIRSKALGCRHCSAPQDDKARDEWLESRTAPKESTIA